MRCGWCRGEPFLLFCVDVDKKKEVWVIVVLVVVVECIFDLLTSQQVIELYDSVEYGNAEEKEEIYQVGRKARLYRKYLQVCILKSCDDGILFKR